MTDNLASTSAGQGEAVAVETFARARAWHHFGIAWDRLEQASRDELIAQTEQFLRSPARPIASAGEWRDIASAPKDGKPQWIGRDGQYPFAEWMRWANGRWEFLDGSHLGEPALGNLLYHPLPSATPIPAASETGEREEIASLRIRISHLRDALRLACLAGDNLDAELAAADVELEADDMAVVSVARADLATARYHLTNDGGAA